MRQYTSILKTLTSTGTWLLFIGMATYAIGDVQGCCDSLEALVAQLPFHPQRDRLWFVGDLVNRGPKSLKVLRRLISARQRAICVLGNHDLHLLALAAGTRKSQPLDTLAPVLRARDSHDLIDWLRTRPLAHAEGNTLMVHAGVLPQWTCAQTLRHANVLSDRLRSRHWMDFMHEMVGGVKPHWSDSAQKQKTLRASLSVFTRLRYLDPHGVPDYKNKLAPDQASQQAGLYPWFEVPNRKTERIRIVFGHWSTLGLMIRPNLVALDTGCVWGRQLTAIRLEDHKVFIQSSLEGPLDED
jgi:bis(5'-nucleosyl)-tetraphosphatase (symmetrical)